METEYQLIDSGGERKLERFGPHLLVRPCSQALWQPSLPSQSWDSADASFSRDQGAGWKMRSRLPKQWVARLQGLNFQIAPTDFGHLGLFPEHSLFWPEMERVIASQPTSPHVLNLFAYSGGATLAAARAGARVCHLDASKGMVEWARENAALNKLETKPIRWIIDDVMKFLKREERRGVRYDGIILDPPSFGRGNQGEVFKIEAHLHDLLEACRKVLSDTPLFVLFTSHTPGLTPLGMRHLMETMMREKNGKIETGEMVIPSPSGRALPSGSFARWSSS